MSCTKKGYKSVFGNPQRTSFVYLDKLEQKYKRSFSVLVPDAVDGLHVLLFARRGHKVTCYETNKTYLEGGIVDGINCVGLKKRLLYESLLSNVIIKSENLYNNLIDKKFDFVYSYRSLHLEENKNIPMSRKIRKLQTAVKENGFIYIFYHLAEDEKDYKKYPKESYLRFGEMKAFFDKESWEVINIIERDKATEHVPHPFHNYEHKHKVGYIFAYKKSSRLKYRLNFNISIADYIS